MHRSLSIERLYSQKRAKKFLVADDNEFVRKAIVRQIKSTFKGCAVAECVNGKEVTEEVKTKHAEYDYILLDVNMPIMNGVEAAKKIREFESRTRLRRLKIIRMLLFCVWRAIKK